MTGTQYEELCRRYIAEMFGIPLASVQSKNIPNAVRPGGAEFEHQIDLWWEIATDRIQVLYIADAKWRGGSKVDKGDVVSLEYARNGVAAHKAMMLTNSAFTEGAYAVADHHAIALHLVKPTFDTSALPTGSSAAERAAVAAALEAAAASASSTPLYSFDVVHRGFAPAAGDNVADTPPQSRPLAPAYVSPVVHTTSAPPAANRGPTAIPSVNRAVTGGWSNRGGGGRSGGGPFGR